MAFDLFKCVECGEFNSFKNVSRLNGVYVCHACYSKGVNYNEVGNGEFSHDRHAYELIGYDISKCGIVFDKELCICNYCSYYGDCLKFHGVAVVDNYNDSSYFQKEFKD